MKNKSLLLVVSTGMLLFISLVSAGTNVTSLNTACAAGDLNQMACSFANASAALIPTPSGTKISCIWNNPGAEHNCSLQVILDTSIITNVMLQGPLIKSMEFIQSGSPANSVIFYSDPFVPHYVHVIANGSLFPVSKDPEFWMAVTGIADITPNAFSFASVNPADMTLAEKAKLEAQYLGQGNITLGHGIAPDLSLIKSFENFTWNLTISYDTGKNLAGTAECNGTISGNSCSGNWSPLPECTTPGNCQKGTYIKDFPSAGLLTVYGADPVPVYGTAVTATQPDLIVQSLNFSPQNPIHGDTITFYAKVKNQGANITDVTVLYNLRVDLSNDETWDVFSPDLSTQVPKTGETLNLTLGNVSGVPVGTHKFSVCVDINNSVNESSEDNNCDSMVFAVSGNIIINEIMYAPSSEFGGTYNEWIELYNPTGNSINLTNWSIADPSDHVFDITGSDIIQSLGFFILAKKLDNFSLYYPVSCPIARVGFTLSNAGEKIILKDSKGVFVDSVNYSSSWGGNGDGYSLERLNPGENSNDPGNWHISSVLGGTPGIENTISTITTTTSTTSTTIPGTCPKKGDKTPCNGSVDDFELLDYINKWANGEVGDFELLEAIDNWAKG